MKTYMFLSESKEHRFCGTCGSSVAIDFLGRRKGKGDIVGINVSCCFFLNLWSFEAGLGMQMSG